MIYFSEKVGRSFQQSFSTADPESVLCNGIKYSVTRPWMSLPATTALEACWSEKTKNEFEDRRYMGYLLSTKTTVIDSHSHAEHPRSGFVINMPLYWSEWILPSLFSCDETALIAIEDMSDSTIKTSLKSEKARTRNDVSADSISRKATSIFFVLRKVTFVDAMACKGTDILAMERTKSL